MLFTIKTLCQQLGVLWPDTTQCTVFSNNIFETVMLTCAPQEENRIDAQNPKPTPVRLNNWCLLHDKCWLSKVLDFGQVLGPCPWILVNIPAFLAVLIDLHCAVFRTCYISVCLVLHACLSSCLYFSSSVLFYILCVSVPAIWLQLTSSHTCLVPFSLIVYMYMYSAPCFWKIISTV